MANVVQLELAAESPTSMRSPLNVPLSPSNTLMMSPNSRPGTPSSTVRVCDRRMPPSSFFTSLPSIRTCTPTMHNDKRAPHASFRDGGLARVFPRITGVDSRATVSSCYCLLHTRDGEREREKEWERRKHWLASHDALAHGRGRVVTLAHVSPFLGSFVSHSRGWGGTVREHREKRRVLYLYC